MNSNYTRYNATRLGLGGRRALFRAACRDAASRPAHFLTRRVTRARARSPRPACFHAATC
eukprot:5053378-Pleurochrysis_carterae.AAC.1